LLENSYHLIYVYLKEYNYIIRKEVDTSFRDFVTRKLRAFMTKIIFLSFMSFFNYCSFTR